MLTYRQRYCFIKNAIARLLLGYVQYKKAARIVNITSRLKLATLEISSPFKKVVETLP